MRHGYRKNVKKYKIHRRSMTISIYTNKFKRNVLLEKDRHKVSSIQDKANNYINEK